LRADPRPAHNNFNNYGYVRRNFFEINPGHSAIFRETGNGDESSGFSSGSNSDRDRANPGHGRKAETRAAEINTLRAQSRFTPPVSTEHAPESAKQAVRGKERIGSYGLEYIQALARLLELISEPKREQLVTFIIEAKIV
jgi:hypothetical protein